MTLITDEIRADFLAFADPATALDVRDREIFWTQSGERRMARLLASEHTGFPKIIYHGTQYNYRQFFASVHMADLRSVAETQRRVMKLQPYVDSTVEVNDETRMPGLHALMQLIQPQVRTRTSIVFLQGEAGVGKTTLLRQLAVNLASEFLSGRNDYLALYVDAQNRSLARLDEAVALELQDIRAKFTYHALASLARIGLLVPIIDGFDELLGARGYEDALSSLLRFLERLSGEGVVVTSARSSFYRFQSVGWLRNATLSGQLDFEVTIATMKNWSDEQIESAIALTGIAEDVALADAHEVLVRTKSAVSPEVWQLFSIPFFVFSFYGIIKVIAEHADTSKAKSLDLKQALPAILEILAKDSLTFLVVGLIKREIPKLKGKGDQPLLVPEDHDKFLREVAEEMWMQETRVLDRSSVEALLEIIVEGEGKATLLEALKGRAGVHPLLISTTEGGLAFRHELFFSYFMAHDLGHYFESRDSKFYRLFGRATVTPTIADQFASFCFGRDPFPPIQGILDQLAPAHAPPSLRIAAQRNAGEVVSAIIRRMGPLVGASTVPAMLFEGTDLRKTQLERTTFRHCDFVDADLRGAEWKGVDLSTCALSRTVLSTDTKLEGMLIPAPESLHGIVFDEETIFEPARIAEVLLSLGCHVALREQLVESSVEQKRRINLLRKLVRATNRTFRFSMSDLKNVGIAQDPEWRLLEHLLGRHGLWETDVISRRGSSAQLKRFSVPTDDLEAGVDGRSKNAHIAAFWREFLSA